MFIPQYPLCVELNAGVTDLASGCSTAGKSSEKGDRRRAPRALSVLQVQQYPECGAIFKSGAAWMLSAVTKSLRKLCLLCAFLFRVLLRVCYMLIPDYFDYSSRKPDGTGMRSMRFVSYLLPLLWCAGKRVSQTQITTDLYS